MQISIIAAVGKKGELGKDNNLIWHFHDDMVFFKNTTMGGTVIMGRKTFESLPKALPKRQNIVISRNENYVAEGAVVCDSAEKALTLSENENVFIIGGGAVYEEFLDRAKVLYLTEIEAECPDATVYFPKFDRALYKKEVLARHEENGIKFLHVKYSKLT